MSAQLSQQNSYTAFLALANGVTANVNAPTLESLAITVAKLQGTAAANEPAAPKVDAGKATPASSPAPASAPAADAGSASSGEALRYTYDHVRDRVLALAKIKRETATEALAKFGVDHGNKLKLEQYPDFIAHADKVLEAAKVAA